MTITATGGDRPRWAFSTVDKGNARNTISLGGAHASSLVLPIVAGATAKGTPLPGATALRGEPNRVYAPASNGAERQAARVRARGFATSTSSSPG